MGSSMPDDIDSLDPWYVTGFCDGEAAFTYSRSSSSGVAVYFALRQRKDNQGVVLSIKKFFKDVGNIYFGKEALPTKNSGHTKENVYFRTTRISDLKHIIDHFDAYPLQSKKKEAYEAWKDLVLHKQKNYGNVNKEIIENLAGKLSALNQKSRAFKKHAK